MTAYVCLISRKRGLWIEHKDLRNNTARSAENSAGAKETYIDSVIPINKRNQSSKCTNMEVAIGVLSRETRDNKFGQDGGL